MANFIPLTAPVVPAPDYTVAKIVASSDLAGAFTRGFAAMAGANAQRESLRL